MECFNKFGNQFDILDEVKRGVAAGINGIIKEEVFFTLAEKTLFMLFTDLSKGDKSGIFAVLMHLLKHFFKGKRF